ncbi:hypothetical protein EVAR_65145_1 [Eumeta japonica]|uniref:Uncharacterized protein n=1 Tax=Eumeta variegata TaxID=151549 RepID=A0A4C2A074_EUMVA|nr:hypothetical protein EVAR_65145_1 [Eumeta japonica]
MSQFDVQAGSRVTCEIVLNTLKPFQLLSRRPPTIGALAPSSARTPFNQPILPSSDFLFLPEKAGNTLVGCLCRSTHCLSEKITRSISRSSRIQRHRSVQKIQDIHFIFTQAEPPAKTSIMVFPRRASGAQTCAADDVLFWPHVRRRVGEMRCIKERQMLFPAWMFYSRARRPRTAPPAVCSRFTP